MATYTAVLALLYTSRLIRYRPPSSLLRLAVLNSMGQGIDPAERKREKESERKEMKKD